MIRDPNRISPLLRKLDELWHLHPELRYGQIHGILLMKVGKDPFYLEDDVWEKAIDSLIESGRKSQNESFK